MGKCIFKLVDDDKREWFLEWSTIVDAPVTYGMSLDALREYVKDKYGSEGLAELPERLARVEQRGHSFHGDSEGEDVIGLIAINRAGLNETMLTYRQMVDVYCHRKPAVRGHECDYGVGGECRDGCAFANAGKVDDR